MYPSTIPTAFQTCPDVSQYQPRVPRLASQIDRCLLFTCRDSNSQLEVYPQDCHLSSSLARLASKLPFFTVAVFDSTPVRALLRAWYVYSIRSISSKPFMIDL